jgi:heptosyltransferase II
MNEVNLVIQTAFLGDLILSVPTLRRIKKNQPDLQLAVVCKKGLGNFLINEGLVDFVFEVEKSNRKSYKEAIENLNTLSLNNVYCLHKSFRSLLFVAQLKAKRKIGYDSFFGFWILDDVVDFEFEKHEVLRQFKILETTDEETRLKFFDDQLTELNDVSQSIPEYFSFKIDKLPKQKTGRVALFPGSVWETKKWTEQGFADLANKLTSAGFKIDFLGGPQEKELCIRIAERAGLGEVLAGQFDIATSLHKVRDYDLVVSNDSAPTHMAVYQNTPVLTIFGPTTSQMGFRPWSNNSDVVELAEMSCRPCGPHGHRVCPLTHHNCMKQISAEMVFEKALFLLNKN